jgi:hypothetical protein
VRISENRYARDLRRLNLAQRLIREEVRTRWIRAWTELSDNRIRNLYRSYGKAFGTVKRRRGPNPMQTSAFLTSPPLRAEASAIGGLAVAYRVIPEVSQPRAPRVGSHLETYERVVDVFELFHQIVPASRFKMEQFIPLIGALAKAEDLGIGHCSNCHGALLIDPLGNNRRLCVACEQDSPKSARRSPRTAPASAPAAACLPPARAPSEEARENAPGEDSGPYQLPLF